MPVPLDTLPPDLADLLVLLRDHYHCRCAPSADDLALTDAAAERVFTAGATYPWDIYQRLLDVLGPAPDWTPWPAFQRPLKRP